MLTHHDIGNKQDVIAIRYFEKEIQEAISNLFVTEYHDASVLSVYSDLSRQLLAVKVLSRAPLQSDPWLELPFNKIARVDFNPRFSLVPAKFVTPRINEGLSQDEQVYVDANMGPGRIHYVQGLLRHHGQYHGAGNTLYIAQLTGVYIMVLFSGKECVFGNSFSCASENEVLYFMLNALSNADIPQRETSVLMDYSMISSVKFKDFFSPYFQHVDYLRLEQSELGNEIPYLHEMLFPNYLVSLCE